MSLLDRLSGAQEPKLPVHQFWASLSEYAGGHISEADIQSAFGLTGGDDLTEWEWLRDKYIASTDKPGFVESMHTIFMLAEKSLYGYNVKATVQARINALP